MQVLLVNPPLYDFTAFDFWLRPYGMLRVAGRIQHACDLTFFDYLISSRRDSWGRGRFPDQEVAKPDVFRDIERRFRRYGRSREEFRALLKTTWFDFALIQTSMTYWYPGVREVIEDLRQLAPQVQIILGGVYASICPAHAGSLGADLVIQGDDLEPLWRFLPAPRSSPPYRNASMGAVAAMKLTDGCPFHCTYCAVPLFRQGFSTRPVAECLEEARNVAGSGGQHVAFYDDALLFHPERVLIPFLEGVLAEGLQLALHTPNALNVRLLTPELAQLMVRAGFRSFFLGLESASSSWLQKTGGKLSADEFAAAVSALRRAGARAVTAYVIIGHPDTEEQEVETAMHFAHKQGARILLSEFAPIPGTLDGERCRKWADLDEPLCHNKTAFTIRRLGAERVNRLKILCRTLNQQR
jgi:pyruvate-formate lyase-activating enzyme